MSILDLSDDASAVVEKAFPTHIPTHINDASEGDSLVFELTDQEALSLGAALHVQQQPAHADADSALAADDLGYVRASPMEVEGLLLEDKSTTDEGAQCEVMLDKLLDATKRSNHEEMLDEHHLGWEESFNELFPDLM